MNKLVPRLAFEQCYRSFEFTIMNFVVFVCTDIEQTTPLRHESEIAELQHGTTPKDDVDGQRWWPGEPAAVSSRVA